MADLNEVSAALRTVVVTALTDNPALGGLSIDVYAGWPDALRLDAGLKAGAMHISIFPKADKVIDSLGSDWQKVSYVTPTITAVRFNSTVTFAGTYAAPCNIAVIAGRVAYVMAVTSGTPTSIAAAFAAAIPGATAVGVVLTAPNTSSAFVGGFGTSIKETRREAREYQVTVWANCFNSRDVVASVMDAAVSDVFRFVVPTAALSDWEYANLRYLRSMSDDGAQAAGVYRRDFFFEVEYAVTLTRQDAAIVTVQTNYQNQIAPLETIYI